MNELEVCEHGKEISVECGECSAEIAASFDPGLVIPCRCNDDGTGCGGALKFLDGDGDLFLDVEKSNEKGVLLDVDGVDTLIANLIAWRAGAGE